MQSPVKLWRNQKKVRDLVGMKGRVISWTIIRVPPAGFSDQAPYIVAIIHLTSGRTITAQLVDIEPTRIVAGLPVVTIIRRITQPSEDGIIPYGIKAKSL